VATEVVSFQHLSQPLAQGALVLSRYKDLSRLGFGALLAATPATLSIIGIKVLPYPVGTTCQVYQGYPPFNHPPEMRYAIDFLMPPRSLVVAARSGVVLAVEQGYDDNDSTIGHENFVILDHGDGTFSRYVHLVQPIHPRMGDNHPRKIIENSAYRSRGR